MPWENLLQTGATFLIGGLGALIGAILLWKFYALPKISKWIIEQGSGRLKAWMAAVVEDPEGAEAQQIGKLTGVAFSYALVGLDELASTKEGRERLAPLMEMVQEHIQQSIFASWGHILNKLKDTGDGMPGMGGMGIPPEMLGLGDKLLPKALKENGIGIPQIMRIAGMLGAFNGGNGSAGGPSGGGSGNTNWQIKY